MENSNKNFIEVNKFQQRILDCIGSGEIDKYFEASRFADTPNAKCAMIYGMAIASLLASDCEQFIGKYYKI